MRVYAFHGCANLPAIGKAAPDDRLRSAFEIGVGAYHRRCLAAELERAADKTLAAGRGNSLAGRDRTGKNAVLDASIDEGRAGTTPTGDHLKQVGWQAGFQVQ